MAANSSQNTAQTKACWAAASCEDHQLAAEPCLGLVKRPSSESMRQQFHSDQAPSKHSKRERESTVVSEQFRRKRMKDLCSKLESLLPSTTLPKLDRRGLFEEACNYIRRLQNELEELKRLRETYLPAKQCGCDDTSMAESAENYGAVNDIDNVKAVVTVYEREAIITVTGLRKPRCHWRIVEEIEAHGLDVQISQFSAGDFIAFLSFQVNVKTENGNPQEIQTSLERRLEAIYKIMVDMVNKVHRFGH